MSPYTSNILAIKRRLEGAPGAPVGLSAAELAYNQVDNTLYYGFSSLDTNTVSSVAIAGSGAFVSLEGSQTIRGNKTFNGDVVFNNPVSFQNSDFNFGNFASYNSLSSLGMATLSATNFVGDKVIVNASTVTTLVSTVPTTDKSNKAASTAFVHGMVDAINDSLAGGLVDVTTNQSIAGDKTFTGSTTLSSTSLGYSKISFVGDPEDPYDAVNRRYVDATASALNIHGAVKLATTEDLNPAIYTALNQGLDDTLVWTSNATWSINHLLQAIDGADLYVGDRILIKDQVDQTQNGVWNVQSFNNLGATTDVTFVRASDYNQSVAGEVAAGDYLFVTYGSVNANRGYVLIGSGSGNNGYFNIGNDNIVFSQFSGAGQITAGTGIRKDGDTLSLTDVGAAGSYLYVTTDAQGRVTSGSNPSSLQGLSAVSMSARKLPLYTGSNSVCAISLTNFGEALVGDTSYNTASATLGLKDMAFQQSNNVSFTGGQVSNLTITTSYIDAGTF
jgi:hypothetical protein